MSVPRVAVMGASGYVGGRLVPALLDRGYEVLCITREPRKLAQRSWIDAPGVSVLQNDLSIPSSDESTVSALGDCVAAFYLVRTSERGDDAVEHQLARRFGQLAADASVRQIIYLSPLTDRHVDTTESGNAERSPALELSLASAGVTVTTLRASMILGSGSASFEILRYLAERLPVMITPRWVKTECQPIAIADVVHWLVESMVTPGAFGRTIEIGGRAIVTYQELMQIMAAELGLRRRWILPVPLLSPRLSSVWIGLVTPVTYREARPFTESLRHRIVVEDELAQTLMPHDVLGVEVAIRRALAVTVAGNVPTRWSAAGPMPGDPDWAGGKVFIDQRSIRIGARPASVFAAVCRVGGGHGWYAGDILWRIRGWMDQLVGGPGLRRGRRHPQDVDFGDALDFWRVVSVERGKRLVLHAEMKVPGTAQLEFGMAPEADDESSSKLTMTARFRPKGLFGLLYWYCVLPLHHIVFGGMLNGIKRTAESYEVR